LESYDSEPLVLLWGFANLGLWYTGISVNLERSITVAEMIKKMCKQMNICIPQITRRIC